MHLKHNHLVEVINNELCLVGILTTLTKGRFLWYNVSFWAKLEISQVLRIAANPN